MIFYGMQGNKAVVALLKDNAVLFIARLSVSPEASIADENGNPVNLSNLKGNSKILVTTDPEYGYQVISAFVER